MMEYLMAINWLAVVVATIVTFILGWAWHSDFAFGKQWRAMTGIAPDKTDMGGAMVKGGLNTALCMVALSILLQMTGITDLMMALKLGVVVWVAASLYDILGGIVWEKEPRMRVVVSAGHTLMVILVGLGILTYMG